MNARFINIAVFYENSYLYLLLYDFIQESSYSIFYVISLEICNLNNVFEKGYYW